METDKNPMDKNSVDSDTDSLIADERKALEISILEDWYGGDLEENRYGDENVDLGAGFFILIPLGLDIIKT